MDIPAARGETKKFVDPRAVIGAHARIGIGCVIGSGAVVPDGTELGDDVTVGPNAVFVEGTASTGGKLTRVGTGVVIGANSTILAGIDLAAACVVRPGSVVGRSVPPRAIVEGNPATIVGYVGVAPSIASSADPARSSGRATLMTSVPGVSVHQFSVVPDLRGNLTVGEFTKEIPFLPLRYFLVFGVPSREVRGEHAHRECHQFLICVRGSCAVIADDGVERVEVILDAPNRGVYLPPMTWGIQYKYSPDAMLLVFASHHYDAADYIREYDDFLELVGRSAA